MLLTVHSVAFNTLRRSSIRTIRAATAPRTSTRGDILCDDIASFCSCLSLGPFSSNSGSAKSLSGKSVFCCEPGPSLELPGDFRKTANNIKPVAKDKSTIAWMGRSGVVSHNATQRQFGSTVGNRRREGVCQKRCAENQAPMIMIRPVSKIY